jgi:hypothetical protein
MEFKCTFHGSYQKLQDVVLLAGIYGYWTDFEFRKEMRTETGAVLSWWPKKGTIYIQGKPQARAVLASAVSIELQKLERRRDRREQRRTRRVSC